MTKPSRSSVPVLSSDSAREAGGTPDLTSAAAAARRAVLLELIDHIDAALRPGFDLEGWLRASFSRRLDFGARERQHFRVALLTWTRFRGWLEPSLARDPAKALAVLCLCLPPGEVRETFAAGLNLPPDERRPLPSRDALQAVDPAGFYTVSELLPAWLIDQAPWTFEDGVIEKWFAPTPMWMRCRPGRRDEIMAVLAPLGLPMRTHPRLPDALGLPADIDVSGLYPYRDGLFEVQDIGAQAIMALCEARPGELWLNTFTGLGRHARALADAVGPSGRVDCSDHRQNEMKALDLGNPLHARKNLRVVDAKTGGGGYDGVFAFALSSCSGLLRHRPWLFHQIDAATFGRFVEAQRELLTESAPRVRPGGRLVYSVSSVCRSETQKVAEWFVGTHADFEVVTPRLAPELARPAAPGWRIRPEDMDCDARYVAVFRRRDQPPAERGRGRSPGAHGAPR
ncbi:MAG: rRNA cytosine-C5-methyltransferase [Burkholderiales bacterium]|nr:rRNA cytosine-C5-methyltransferase [Opitutaceae bacterium]